MPLTGWNLSFFLHQFIIYSFLTSRAFLSLHRLNPLPITKTFCMFLYNLYVAKSNKHFLPQPQLTLLITSSFLKYYSFGFCELHSPAYWFPSLTASFLESPSFSNHWMLLGGPQDFILAFLFFTPVFPISSRIHFVHSAIAFIVAI